jgi:hypothetical protein
LEAGDLVLQNNIWFGFGAGPTPNEFIAQDFARTYVTNAANNNRFVDPQLRGISRTNDKGLDPRPQPTSPVWSNFANIPGGDNFFVQTNYVGAFGEVNWAADWTFISHLGVLNTSGSGIPTKVEERIISGRQPSDYALSQNYPNPFNPSTNINYAVAKTGFVRLAVYNVLGQQVATLVEGVRAAGSYSVTWDASNLTSSMYFYRLETNGVVLTRKMLLAR